MQIVQMDYQTDFKVLIGNERAQAAVMVLQPGESTGGPDNRHAEADQWLFVVSGEGWAIVDGQQVRLHPGVLLLIEPGEGHEIRAEAAAPLRTVNIYTPPEY
jgi:mannose-6-phosphate isomerase-like protein (cupin superfamily)